MNRLEFIALMLSPLLAPFVKKKRIPPWADAYPDSPKMTLMVSTEEGTQFFEIKGETLGQMMVYDHELSSDETNQLISHAEHHLNVTRWGNG
jgi:hypothetical protein